MVSRSIAKWDCSRGKKELPFAGYQWFDGILREEFENMVAIPREDSLEWHLRMCSPSFHQPPGRKPIKNLVYPLFSWVKILPNALEIDRFHEVLDVAIAGYSTLSATSIGPRFNRWWKKTSK